MNDIYVKAAKTETLEIYRDGNYNTSSEKKQNIKRNVAIQTGPDELFTVFIEQFVPNHDNLFSLISHLKNIFSGNERKEFCFKYDNHTITFKPISPEQHSVKHEIVKNDHMKKTYATIASDIFLYYLGFDLERAARFVEIV